MISTKGLKAIICLFAIASLAACSSGGSSTNSGGLAGGGATGGGATGGGSTGGGATGGGATGGGATGGGTPQLTPAEFDAKVLDYTFRVPTSTPLSGTAGYTGRISLLTLANTIDPTEAVHGDLNLNVDFDSTTATPVTGTAGNFAGQINGVDRTVTGTLDTANAIAGDVNSVDVNVTGAGTLTSVTTFMRGDLSDPDGALTGSARMILNGNLKEANGAIMAGGHQTTITPTTGSNIGTGGSFYADRN
ncbi:MAG: hypothetical protein P1U53_04570 [Sulfitobacter sp.]|nr:hypothetical protein [Sulfitobacter sp.]